MNKKLLWLIILILITLLNFGSIFAEAEKETDNLKGLDSLIEKEMKEWQVPGLAIAIVKDDRVIYAKGYGFRDVEKQLKVTPETIFAIASNTKSMTCFALGILEDEGKFDWNRPIKDYLPDFKLKDEYATNHVSAKDLVLHQSGVPGHDSVWYGSNLSRDDVYNILQYLEPSKELRSGWQYNNMMYVVLGKIIEKISGKSWEEFMNDKLLTPLEMSSTSFSIKDLTNSNNYSLAYSNNSGEIKKIEYRDLDNIAPAGAINSNVKEMANWLIFNLNGGKFKDKQIISEAIVNKLNNPRVIIPSYSDYKELFYNTYSLGWVVTTYRGNTIYFNTGEIDGFRAIMSYMPAENIGIVVLSTTRNFIADLITYNIYDKMLGLEEVPWFDRARENIAKAEETKKTITNLPDTIKKLNTKPSHKLEDYAGRYKHPAYGLVIIEKDGNKLKGNMREDFSIRHYHYEIFEAYDEKDIETSKIKITFYTNSNGDVNKLSMPLVADIDEIIFDKILDDKNKQ
ncbi:MAG: serine hydrolase [Cyanobacteriota bacterium]